MVTARRVSSARLRELSVPVALGLYPYVARSADRVAGYRYVRRAVDQHRHHVAAIHLSDRVNRIVGNGAVVHVIDRIERGVAGLRYGVVGECEKAGPQVYTN